MTKLSLIFGRFARRRLDRSTLSSARFDLAVLMTFVLAICGSIAGIPLSASAVPTQGSRSSHATAAAADFSADSSSSNDLAVDGVGDSAGYHVRIALESKGFVWKDLAVIKPANLDEETWYGYQCLTADGNFVAVAILPGSVENTASARLSGAFAYAVNVATGTVTPIATGVGSLYYSPACGLDDSAVFSSSLGEDEQQTQIVRADLTTGKIESDSILAGEVTSATPVGSAIVAAFQATLVTVPTGGTPAQPASPEKISDLPGSAFDIVPSMDGGFDFLTVAKARSAEVWHRVKDKSTRLGSGSLSDTHIYLGRGGLNKVTGAKALTSTSDLKALSITKLPLDSTTVSLDGDAAFGPTPTKPATTPSKVSVDAITTTSDVAQTEATKTHHLFKSNFSKSGTSSVAAPGTTLPGAGGTHSAPTQPAPKMKTTAYVGTGSATFGFSGNMLLASLPNSVATIAPLLSPGATTPKCSINRLLPTEQPMQESNAQVNWAVQMAERGLLTGSTYTRPTNFGGMGLVAYAPSSDFPPVGLSHPSSDTWNTVPRSVMEAIMAQESNFDQASWHAISGIAADPLIADYYGSAGGITSIYYPSADCGYGIAQVTTGMAATDTSLSLHGQMKVADDYEENIAAGLQILEKIWNQLYTSGITDNGGDPRYLENWFDAAWAYNSGIQPTAAYGNTSGCTPSASCAGPDGTWGLGWSNNPANPAYNPARSPFLETSYADAAHPSSWPYEERVMGFMGSPLARNAHTAYATPTYQGSQTWLQIPSPSYFCASGNDCSSTPAYHCTLADSECWTHYSVTWVSSCSTTCATSSYDVATNSTEPTYANPYPPDCQLDASQVPSTPSGSPIVVDDLATPSQNMEGCGSFNWSSSGTFTLSPGTNSSGDPIGNIDLHQLGVGFGGHIYFTHSEDGSNPALIDTGTWTPTLPSHQYYEIKVHIPDRAAVVTDAHYVVNPGGGAPAVTVALNQDYETNAWVDLGTFAMQSGGNVKLTNLSSMTPGAYDIAFDAMAFVPRGGTPGTPIGGSPALLSTPAWTNPSLLNCLCGLGLFGDPVNSGTGYFGETQSDLSTPGIGAALTVSRTYSSSLADPSGPAGSSAVEEGFGPGWSYSYGLSAVTNPTTGAVIIRQEDGSDVSFTSAGSGTYTVDQPRFDATLSKSGSTYTFIRHGSAFFTFDVSSGDLTSESDLAGTVASPHDSTTLAYNASGQLQTVTDPAGRTYSFTWSGSHIAAIVTSGGQEVDYSYNAAGDLTDVYGVGSGRHLGTPDNQDHRQYGYDPNGLLTSEVSPSNYGKTGTPVAATSMVYDGSERVTSQTDPMGNTTTFVYGPNSGAGITAGQTLVTDPAGHKTLDTYSNGLLASETIGYGSSTPETTSYTYDPLTLGPVSISHPDGSVETFSYDAHGNRISSTDGLGRTTSTRYDNAGHVLETTTPDMRQTITIYNSAGSPTSVSILQPGQDAEVADGNLPPSNARTETATYTDAAHPSEPNASTDFLGNATSFTYNSYGYVTSVTNAASRVTKYGYDNANGWLTSMVSASGVAAGTTTSCTPPATGCTTYAHDAWGRTTSTTDPAGDTASATFDADGNQLSATDANGHTANYAFDNDGRQVSSTTAGSATSSTAFNSDSTVASTTDGNGNSTSYSYDSLGRLGSTTDADGEVTSFTYDPAGRPLTQSNPGGSIVHQTWDVANELTGRSYSGGVSTPSVTYTYTVDGQPATMTDGTGTTTYTYDAYGELAAVTSGSGSTLGYSYNADGQQTSIAYPGTSNSISKGYNSIGQETSVVDAAGRSTTFAYSADGALLTTTAPNGTVVTDTYDANNRLATTTIASSGATLGKLTYGRDSDGSVTSVAPSGGAPGSSATYSYDNSQQLTGTTVGSTTLADTYDSASSPTKVDGTNEVLDSAGRLCWSISSTISSPACGAPATGATVYSSNSDGQRTATTPSSGTATAFSWNAAGELTGISGPATASYTYDGSGLRASKTVGTTTTSFTWDTSSTVPELLTDGSVDYIYGPNGAPLEQTSPGGASPLWYFTDQQGSTQELTNLSGTVVGVYSYSSWGSVTTHTGSSTPLEYDGQYTDAESGLVYLRARYFDPTTALFISVDPGLAATGVPYGYAANDPIDNIDPLGLWSWGDTGLAIVAGLLVVGIVVASASVVGSPLDLLLGAAEVGVDGAIAADVAVDATAGAVAESGAAGAADEAAEGGVYSLRDADGNVVRTGRTNNLVRRAAEHARDPELSQYSFNIEYETDDYATQRGLEQYLHEQYNPPLDKVAGISARNPNYEMYMKSGKDYLGECS